MIVKAPWLTNNIPLFLQLRDYALRTAKKSGNFAHLNYYKMLRNYTTSAVHKENRAYMEHNVQSNNVQNLENFNNSNILSNQTHTISEYPSDANAAPELRDY